MSSSNEFTDLSDFENVTSEVRLYFPRESSWDPLSLHGRMHIHRCLFHADRMMVAYRTAGISVKEELVRIAILFHDVGRRGHGRDIWEADSARLARKAMAEAGYDARQIDIVNDCILRERMDTLEAQVVRDADVLDYHRFMILPQEASFFQEDRLAFGGPFDISGYGNEEARREIIAFARYLVQHSECIEVLAADEEIRRELQAVANDFRFAGA